MIINTNQVTNPADLKIADYIVDQGTKTVDGIVWHYEKYASGECKLRCEDCGIALGTGTAWMGGYFHLQTYAIELPFTVNKAQLKGFKNSAIIANYIGCVWTGNKFKSYWQTSSAGSYGGTEFIGCVFEVKGMWK